MHLIVRVALILHPILVQSTPQAAGKVSEAPDGPRGGGALFSKCGNYLCYEVTIIKLQVQMGPDGTNDDVSAKICSDDKATCCETPALKSVLSNDWSSKDLETWGPRYFGPCKNARLKINKGIELTLNKKGSDSLAVDTIFVEAELINTEGQREVERFDCGSYNFTSGNLTSIPKFCKTSQYAYERISKITGNIGGQGTTDTVKAEFCSDINPVCCKVQLKEGVGAKWSERNTIGVWSDLGECGLTQYKVTGSGGPKFTLSKDGKKDLEVSKIVFETESTDGSRYKYDCDSFKLASQGLPCVTGVSCSQTKVCKKTKL